MFFTLSIFLLFDCLDMKFVFFAFLLVAALAIVQNPNYIYYSELGGKPYTVTYDKRSFFINGRRTLFLGGAVHYPRATPGIFVTYSLSIV